MASLKLETNVPETIALAFADGLPTTSPRFGGDQVMFTLVDGRKWYTAPFIADKIAAAKIPAKTPFTVCKREIKEGNRLSVRYEIEAGAIASSPAPVGVLPGNGVTSTSATLSHATNGNGHAHHATNGQAVAAPSSDSPAVVAMKFAGMAAIDAVLEVEKHAQLRGMTDFSFGPENIQKIMISLYIDIRKGGRA